MPSLNQDLSPKSFQGKAAVACHDSPVFSKLAASFLRRTRLIDSLNPHSGRLDRRFDSEVCKLLLAAKDPETELTKTDDLQQILCHLLSKDASLRSYRTSPRRFLQRVTKNLISAKAFHGKGKV